MHAPLLLLQLLSLLPAADMFDKYLELTLSLTQFSVLLNSFYSHNRQTLTSGPRRLCPENKKTQSISESGPLKSDAANTTTTEHVATLNATPA